MSQGIETFIRTLGGVVAFAVISAVLGFFGSASNLTFLGTSAPVIAALAASLLAVWDKTHSQDGTVLFGTVGKTRF
jgi:hypothetical protein